jgi:hypothetical protein
LYVITYGGGGGLVIKRWGEGGDVPLSLSLCIVTCDGVGISNEKKQGWGTYRHPPHYCPARRHHHRHCRIVVGGGRGGGGGGGDDDDGGGGGGCWVVVVVAELWWLLLGCGALRAVWLLFWVCLGDAAHHVIHVGTCRPNLSN